MSNTQTGIARQALQGVKIRDAEDWQIGKKLTIVYSLVGLRPQHYPTREQDKLLFDFMRMNYPAKTLDEIVLAFNMLIQGELEVKPDDAKVYDQFTCEYLARVMTAYRRWLLRVNENHIEEKPKNHPRLTNTITSYEDKVKEIERWKEKELPEHIEMIPLYLYDYLLATKELELTNDDKWEYAEQAGKFRKEELDKWFEDVTIKKYQNEIDDYKVFCEQFKKGCVTGKEVNRIRSIAKKLAVLDYLKASKL